MAAYGKTLNELRNRVLFLLREQTYNQDPTQAPVIPIPADFPLAWLDLDLNYAQQVLMSAAGLAPRLTEKVVTLPMVAGLDYTLPADLSSLTRIEYLSPSVNATPYPLIERNFDAFDIVTSAGFGQGSVGAPTDYRSPFGNTGGVAGGGQGTVKIRLWPQPTFGNAGQASGQLVIGGNPVAGNTVFATLSDGISNWTAGPYIVTATDTIFSIALGLAALINASPAVTGGAFQTTFTQGTASIQLAANVIGAPGNAYSYFGMQVGGGALITPTAKTFLAGGGQNDSIIIYYTGLGNLMISGTDYPGLPAQFHDGLADYVLSIYWRRKQDPDKQAQRYAADWIQRVREMKAFPLDSDRASTPAFEDEEAVHGGYSGGMSL
jgi:hypothetical protein